MNNSPSMKKLASGMSPIFFFALGFGLLVWAIYISPSDLPNTPVKLINLVKSTIVLASSASFAVSFGRKEAAVILSLGAMSFAGFLWSGLQ